MSSLTTEQLAEKTLERLRSKPGQLFDPAKLGSLWKVTVEQVVSAIALLRSWGYVIKANHKRHYRFIAAPDSFIATEIGYHLKTRIMGRNLLSYMSVQSTNSIASQLAAAKAPEGTLVIAEHQTRGRGRLGRDWYSPEKVGLYASLILYPRIHPTEAPGISLVTAVALADTISSYDDIDVAIKWPNDVLVSGLKVAGILTELSAELDRVEYVIVGVGVNINQSRADFPADLRETATSIRIGNKEKIHRVKFLQQFLFKFEKEYLVFKKSGLKEARRKILKYSYLLNKEVRLKIGRKVVSGTVINIDETGRLVLDTKDGITAFNAGEVTTH